MVPVVKAEDVQLSLREFVQQPERLYFKEAPRRDATSGSMMVKLQALLAVQEGRDQREHDGAG